MRLLSRITRSLLLLGFLLGLSRLDAQPAEQLVAPTPAGAEVVVSATRAEIVLNGLWRWLPAAAASETAPAATAEWGLAWVPGAWGTKMWGHYSNTGPGSGTPGVHKTGGSEEWESWGEDLQRAWYEREFTVPASWTGRAIVLQFDRLATDAELWLDGASLSRVSWPGGEVDISTVVKPGKVQRLRVLLSAVQTATEAINYMGVGQNTATKASLDLRGITGDVVLVARPATARVTDVFVKTSVREGRLTLDTEFIGVRPGATLSLDAVVVAAADGLPVRTFTAQVVATAPDAQTAPGSTAVVRGLSWDWADARRWDLDDPYLYRLELRLRTVGAADAAAPQDAFPVTFGFREFWSEGREFYLNGTRIRLRPALFNGSLGGMANADSLPAEFARWKNHGRNFLEVWPSPKDRGSRVQDGIVAEAADVAGILLAVPTVRINEYAKGPGYTPIWDKPEGAASWIPAFHADWRRLRNHPSIVLIGLSGNAGGHSQDQSPRWIGRRAMPPGTSGEPAQAASDKLATAFDPTRLRWHHQGGVYGDVFTVNHYLNFIPLQEREEWFSEWAKTGDMPYSGVEFGTPFNASFLRGRDGFGNSIATEPFLAEYAATYLGSAAYTLQGDEYARAIRGRFVRPDEATGGRWSSWQNRGELNFSPAFQAMQDLFIVRTWRAWRTEGVSGGMIPWDEGYAVQNKPSARTPMTWRAGQRGWFVPTLGSAALATSFHDKESFRVNPAGLAFEAVNGPTLAWIAGAPGRLHAKDHHVVAAGVIEKQFALLNDTRAPQPFRAAWRIEDAAGTRLAHGEESGQLAVGETRLLPFTYTAPSGLAAGAKQDLVLRLDADIGGHAQSDSFAFRVYGAPAEAAAPAIVLYDPAGHTARLLTELGVAFTPFATPAAAAAPGTLLVLGRDSLTTGVLPFDLGAFVTAGGRALLMQQSPSWVRRNLGLRVAPVPARRLFTVPTAKDFAAGLDATDLADWNGAGTLLEARPDYNVMPAHGWRWGNVGSVSSAMIEKPHRSGWTPLLEGEWDLAYSPLMELGYGQGRLTWCTLDLEDQAAADPAAARLALRVLAQAARPVTTPRVGEVVYVGTPAGAALLRHAGVLFRTAKAPDAKTSLLVVDAATPLTDAQVEAFARQGGTVVMLAQPGGDTPPRLGTKLRLERKFLGGTAPEANPLTRGLSASDLRLRTPRDTRLLAEGAQLAAGGLLGARAVGSGRIMFIQFDPLGFDLEKDPFYKHTQWRLTRAYSQVLANLGASFAADRMVFNPQVMRVDLAGPWAVKFTRELPVVPWDKAHADPGISPVAQAALAEKVDTSAWETFSLPANHPRFSEVSGEAVWRRELNLPAEWAGETALLHIPGIKSFDTVTLNGVVIGSTSKDTDPKNPNPWNTPRTYRILPGLIRAGANVLAIRQFVPDKEGGVHGRPERFYLQLLVPDSKRILFYVDNWNDDAKYGDDPYRYYRW